MAKPNKWSDIKFLYLPFFILNVGCLVVYSILNFLFLQKIDWLNEVVSNFLLPFLLISFVLIIFYKQHLKILLFNDDFRAFVLLLIFCIPPVLLSQNIAANLSIQIHHITDSNKLIESSGHYIYHIDNLHIDKNDNEKIYPNRYTTPTKQGIDDLHLEVYIVTKIISPQSGNLVLWYGKKYSEIHNHNTSDQESQNAILEQFVKNCLFDFKSKREVEHNIVLELDTKDSDYKNFEIAVPKQLFDKTINNVILTDSSSNLSMSFKIKATLITFFVGQLIWFLICVFKRISFGQIEYLNSLNQEKKKSLFIKDIKDTFQYFIPQKNYTLTPILLDINIFVFLVMSLCGVSMIHPTGLDLIHWGSIFTPLIKKGQIWRLITAGFIHSGFFHILMNMLALGFAGFLIEKVLGTKRTAILYFASIIGSSVISIWWHLPVVNSVGASGGIFGIFGAMLVYSIFDIAHPENRVAFMFIFGLFGFFTLFMGFTGINNADNAGHVGGLITGAIVSLFFISTARRAKNILEE